MSYIEKEKAIHMLRGECVAKYPSSFSMGLFASADEISKMPDADVVEVVRCKDCKYYEIHKPTITLNCEREGKLVPMMPNDYCSYGERS